MALSEYTLRGIELTRWHKSFQVIVREDDALELVVDGCVRKRREPLEREPQYIWTNIELDWEQHHYVEARFWRSSDLLKVTVNGEPVFEGAPPLIAAAR